MENLVYDIDIKTKMNNLSGYTFIDLFAGIGGFHLALSSFKARCVFASEWDIPASKVYEDNFGLLPNGDITKTDERDIPKHDILCAGFPCQAFSISGLQKGFLDTRGTLFFDIARIASYHKPKILFLENVKNFAKHDNGNTLGVVVKTLEDIGYNVFYNVLNAGDFGLPQNRERIYFVCFRSDLKINHFEFPKSKEIKTALIDYLEDYPSAKFIERDDIIMNKEFEPDLDIFGELNLPNKTLQIGKVNKGGQGERIYSIYGHACTLSAYGGGVGSKTGIYLVKGKLRKLSPRECARIQGFPDSFKIDKSPSQAYKQFGNSVAVNVLKEILSKIIEVV